MLRPTALLIAALLLGAPARPASAAADSLPPTVGNFGITDCEGNMMDNQVVTSTGQVTVRIRAFDHNGSTNSALAGMGLRLKTVQHVGGGAASTNLVSFLHLDDAGSGTAVSTATAGNAGTPNAALTGVGSMTCGSGNGFTGLAGDNCYVWDGNGSTDRITIPATASLNSTTSQLTLQAWIYPANLTSAPILEFNDNTTFGPHFWHSFPSNNGELFANLIDSAGASHVVASTAGFVKANQWQLVTLTYNGTLARLFHNGVEIASRTFVGMPPLKTQFPLQVGSRPSAANTFAGRIDEVRVFNKALADDEVEGDVYGGVMLVKTTSSATAPFSVTRLDPAVHYTPANPANGFQSPATATVTNLHLAPGPSNQVIFNFQDIVGNTRRSAFGITVIESVPDVPTNVQATGITTSGITWTWSRGTRLCLMAGGGAGQYIGKRAATGVTVYPSNATASFAEGSLSANTLYGFQVQAVDAFGTSALTQPTSAYTLAAAPTGLGVASVSTGSAVLSWSSTNPAWTRFEVTLSTDNFATSLSTPVPVSNNLTATTTGFASLTPQTTYYVRVRAVNGDASDLNTAGGTYTAPLSGTFNTLPNAPGTLQGNAAGATALTWTWTAVPTATSYTLDSTTGTTLVVTGGLSHTVSNLSPNAVYQARLRANTPSGSGAFGPDVSAFTDPLPPTGTAVSNVATSTARISWAANGNPAGTSFQVQVATLAGFGSLLNTVSVISTQTTLTSLLPASTYYARVRASGFNGNGTAFDTAVSFVTDRFGAVSSTNAPPTPYALLGPEVGVWHFDESSGTAPGDSSGFLNHGSLTGTLTSSTPTFVAGQTGLGNALRFPGLLGSVMTAAHSASLSGTGDLTIEAWVNPAAVLQVSDAGVVVKGTGTDETYMLDVSSSGRWRFAVRDGTGALFAVFSTQSVRAGAWAHIAGVYVSGATPSLSLYVDGTLSDSKSGASAPSARRVTAGSLSIGSRRSGTSVFDRSFRGDLDEVHVVTAAYSAARIGADYAAAQPATVVPPSPNDGVRIIVPPNAFGGAAVLLMSSSPLTVPITISPSILADGVSSPPSGQTLVPNSVFEIVANVGGSAFTGALGSTVTLALPYPDADGNGLVDGTFPPIPVENLKMYTLNTAVTRWEQLPSSVDTANRRVLGQTPHFSVFALFGPTGIRPDTDQVRLYPRPWRPGSGTKFDSVTFGGRTGLAIDNLTASGNVKIFSLSGELVRELSYGSSNVGTLIWDGTNHAGRKVASGVYFAVVKPDSGGQIVLKFAVER